MVKTDNRKEDYIELLKQADISPLVTPAHLATTMDILIKQLNDNFKEWSQNQASAVKTEWATVSQLAKIIGVSRRTMERILPEICREHTIRVIQGYDYLGRKGHRRYRIEDVEKAMEVPQAA